MENMYKKAFARFAEMGITDAISVNPPKGGDGQVRIETDGSLSMIDTRSGKRRKIDPADDFVFSCDQCGSENYTTGAKRYDDEGNVEAQIVVCADCKKEFVKEWDG